MFHFENFTRLGVTSSLSQNVGTALKNLGQVYHGTSKLKKKKFFCCKSANGIKHFNSFDKYSVCLTSPSPKKTLHTKTRKKSQTRAREGNVAQGGCVPLSRAPTPALKSVSGTKGLVTFDRWPVVNLFPATEGTVSFNLCFILVPWAAEGVLLKFTAWPGSTVSLCWWFTVG